MRLEWLEYFSDTALLGSIKAAAEKYSISPQGLSKCIRSLEAELGVKLFEREANSVRLTPEGARLLGQARATIDAAQELARQAHDIAGGDAKSPLAVMCSTFVFLCGMMSPLRDGMKRMGRMATYVQTPTDSILKIWRAKTDPLYEGRVLCGIPILFDTLKAKNDNELMKAEMNGYDYTPLLKYSDRALISNKHPLATCKKVSKSILAQYPIIASSAEQRAAMESYLGVRNITSAIADATTRLQAIEDGESIVFMPPFLEAMSDSRFRALQIEDAYMVEVGFIHDRSMLSLNDLQPLLEALASKFAPYEADGLCTLLYQA